MEKLSLNNILSLLLPGMYVMFLGYFIDTYVESILYINNEKLFATFRNNEFLQSAVYLLVALVLGAITNWLTISIIEKKWYAKYVGLYEHCGKVFKEDKALATWNTFFDADCTSILGKPFLSPEKLDAKERIEWKKHQGRYFDYIFFYLMAHEKLNETRNYQGFYFLFRNMVTVSAFMLLVGLTGYLLRLLQMGYCADETVSFISFFVVLSLVGILIFRKLGIFYRRRIVKTLFFCYMIAKTTKTEEDHEPDNRLITFPGDNKTHFFSPYKRAQLLNVIKGIKSISGLNCS